MPPSDDIARQREPYKDVNLFIISVLSFFDNRGYDGCCNGDYGEVGGGAENENSEAAEEATYVIEIFGELFQNLRAEAVGGLFNSVNLAYTQLDR